MSQRVEKNLRDCATFTDGFTDRQEPVGTSQRVAKKLQDCATITDSFTDDITDRMTHIAKRMHV